jgi:hypothetical protein
MVPRMPAKSFSVSGRPPLRPGWCRCPHAEPDEAVAARALPEHAHAGHAGEAAVEAGEHVALPVAPMFQKKRSVTRRSKLVFLKIFRLVT